MKTNLAPWPAIRWMAAGVIYLLTIAIAVDQVRTRQARIDQLEAGLKDIHAGIRELQKTNEQQIQDAERAVSLLEAQERAQKEKVIRTLQEFQSKYSEER